MTEQLQIKSLNDALLSDKIAGILINELKGCGWAGAVADYASQMEKREIYLYGKRTHAADEYARVCEYFVKLQDFGLNLIPQVVASLFIVDQESAGLFWKKLSRQSVTNFDLTHLTYEEYRTDDRALEFVAELAFVTVIGLRELAYRGSNSWLDKGTGKQIRDYFDALSDPLKRSCAFLCSRIKSHDLRVKCHLEHKKRLAIHNKNLAKWPQLMPFDGLDGEQYKPANSVQ